MLMVIDANISVYTANKAYNPVQHKNTAAVKHSGVRLVLYTNY
jgi:hypothetical protein